MFKALLLATVAGVSAANAPASAPELAARGNQIPPSYLCSHVNKKCSSPKARASVTAYCASLLKAPHIVTKTKRTTFYESRTTSRTVYVATVTIPAATVTSTVTSCTAPTTTIVAAAAGGSPQKRAPEAYTPPGYGYGHGGIQKPSCLSSYKNAAQVTSACKCAPIAPRTTTITSSSTVTVQSTSTVQATTTMTEGTSTSYTLQVTPTFVVADENDNYFQHYFGTDPKDIQSGVGFDNSDITNAVLFELNNGQLLGTADFYTDDTGTTAAEAADEQDPTDTQDDISVSLATTESVESGAFRAITCSASYAPADGTCPLVCQYSSVADRNLEPQLRGDVSWYLGPPNTVDDGTYKTYAVTRGQPPVRGGMQRKRFAGVRR